MVNKDKEKLKKAIMHNANKLDKARKERKNHLAELAYLGVLGLVFIIPVVIGAYLGVWLDNKLTGFSVSWTITFILLGVIIGVINVYLLIKEK